MAELFEGDCFDILPFINDNSIDLFIIGIKALIGLPFCKILKGGFEIIQSIFLL